MAYGFQWNLEHFDTSAYIRFSSRHYWAQYCVQHASLQPGSEYLCVRPTQSIIVTQITHSMQSFLRYIIITKKRFCCSSQRCVFFSRWRSGSARIAAFLRRTCRYLAGLADVLSAVRVWGSRTATQSASGATGARIGVHAACVHFVWPPRRWPSTKMRS